MEDDTKLLENRIKMLQKEEEKLLGKIENTRKRVQEINEIREKNDHQFQ